MKVFMSFSGGAGPMIRCLPIGLELQRRGYDIYYYSRDYSSVYSNQCNFKQVLVSYPKRYDCGLGVTAEWVDLEHFAASYENQYDYFEMKYEYWIKCMRDLKPDVIISDFSLGASISALVLGIPLVSISQSCYLYPIGNKGGIRWWDDLIKPKECHIKENLNAFLNKYGIKGYDVFEEIFLEKKVFLPSIPEFDPLDIENEITYVGPILWQGNEFQSKLCQKHDRKRIFVYLGRLTDTCGDTGIKIYNMVMKAAQYIDADFVVSNGNFEEIKEVPLDNVAIETKWMSIKEIYENSDLVIHHGGHNSCLGSLLYGTPSLIIPTHTEREYNARRMVEMGTGKMILPNIDSEKQLIDSIHEMMNNDSYKNACNKYKKVINSYYCNGEKIVADYVDAVAKK